MSATELQCAYLGTVMRYVSLFIRPVEDAEDVAMEVFHAAFASMHRLRRGDSEKVWLLGIARRKVADALRIRYRRGETRLAAAQELPAGAPEEVHQRLQVVQLLREMPKDQREVLILKYVNGLSTREVAQVVGRSEAAANSLLQRAREHFYEMGASLFLDRQEVIL